MVNIRLIRANVGAAVQKTAHKNVDGMNTVTQDQFKDRDDPESSSDGVGSATRGAFPSQNSSRRSTRVIRSKRQKRFGQQSSLQEFCSQEF